MALGRAATAQSRAGWRRFLRQSPDGRTARNPRRRRSLTAGGRSHVGPPPSGRVGAGFQPAVLVRESNPRQPDSWSGALPTELTSLDTTIGQNPCTEHTPPTASSRGQGSVRRWPGRIIASKRRRWESNPLEPRCSRSPCRLAPALSFVQCPRQESNLVFDLRRVACKSATLRGRFPFSAPPRNRTSSCSFEDCRAVRHTRRASVSRPGLEPGSGPSEGPMRSLTPSRRSVSRPGVEPGPRP